MKHLILLADGMADHPIERLGGKTLMQCAYKPWMDMLARNGRTGKLQTIPKGFHPGSEVAITSIMGYCLNRVFEGRGPLEAASMGYEMKNGDLAIRCNLVSLENARLTSYKGGGVTTADAALLIGYLNEHLGNENVRFMAGIQYRHLLIVRGGSKHIVCALPHDHHGEEWHDLMVRSEDGWENRRETYKDETGTVQKRMTGLQTARLLNNLMEQSQVLLAKHPYNQVRLSRGELQANCIWPWSGGYRPLMEKMSHLYPQVTSGSVVAAVDLVQGLAHYAGLDIIKVKGATALPDTNYEGKAQAAIEALKWQDFVFLHVEAIDEAGHSGDIDLKLKTIEDFDKRIVKPIFREIEKWEEPVCIAVLPDHPTPVETGMHADEPVPFLIWHKKIKADSVQTFDEMSCKKGGYGLLRLHEFMQTLMGIR